MYDSHLHSHFSFDTNVSQQAMCEQAFALGLAGICFTEHTDFYEDAAAGHWVDLPGYALATAAQTEIWQGKLKVACGLELGLQPFVHQRNRAYLQGHSLDFILGSIHVVDGLELCGGDFCAGKTKEEAYGRYLEVLLAQVQQAEYIHVLGHFDVVRRYGDFGNNAFPLSLFQEISAEIFTCLIQRGQGIELNTGGLRCGLDTTHPDLATLRLYRSLGGEIITLGSDAHMPASLGAGLPLAVDLLRQAGFSSYSYFLQGREQRVGIGV